MSSPAEDVSLKLWSCVGSAGVVNPPDLGKVIFNNSIVQLGPSAPSGGVIESENRLGSEARIAGETITATIRYGVVPVEGLYVGVDRRPPLDLALALRYRDGSGYVVAKFIQVTLNDGTEYPIFTFDSRQIQPARDVFQRQYSDWQSVPVDFVMCAYYVELTLGATEQPNGLPLAFPPAVSAIQLLDVSESGRSESRASKKH
jgi:hypothetical protein